MAKQYDGEMTDEKCLFHVGLVNPLSSFDSETVYMCMWKNVFTVLSFNRRCQCSPGHAVAHLPFPVGLICCV